MNRLEQILRALCWLPILLGGLVGFAFIEPRFQIFGIICAGLLGVFVFLVLLQAASERKALSRSRSEQTAIMRELASGDGDYPGATEKNRNERSELKA